MIIHDPRTQERAWELIAKCLGPMIMAALDQGEATDIIVNADGAIWVYRPGGKEKLATPLNPSQVTAFLKMLATLNGEALGDKQTSIATVLPAYGTRVQGGIPPQSPGPFFALRRHVTQVIPLSQFVLEARMTAAEAAILQGLVRERKNLVIIGATGSGKTTLANSLLAEIEDPQERIISLEDQRELQIASADWQPMYTTSSLDMAGLVEQCQRLRPDRIVVGEARRGDVLLGWLQASLSISAGSMTTFHGGSVEAGLRRMEILLSGVMASGAGELIRTAVDAVILLSRRGGQPGLAQIHPLREENHHGERKRL
jgi:type IV secretion system protein VirB11